MIYMSLHVTLWSVQGQVEPSPTLWGEGMVQSADARLFLIEKELLQLQFYLRTGNGTFQIKLRREDRVRTLYCLYRGGLQTPSKHVQSVIVKAVVWQTYSLCLSLCSSAAAVVAPVGVSPALRVFVALVSSSAPAPVAASLPTALVVAYTHTYTQTHTHTP